MMPKGDPKGQIFLSQTPTNNSFSCSSLNSAFLYLKGFKTFMNMLRCDIT